MLSNVFSLLASVVLLGFAAQSPQGPVERDLRLGAGRAAVLNDASSPNIPKSYAVVIGIASYRDLKNEQQLHFSERDAEAIYSTLISPEGGNFKAENVHRLIGSAATGKAIRRELEEWLPSIARADDRVLIYFAGHGFVQDGTPYLAPYDLNPDDIHGTGYAMSALGDSFGRKINARWKVLLTDACHSGAIQPAADVQQMNRSLADLSQSIFSLTASRDRERSFEDAGWGGGHGIFTYYVVKAMEGAADANRDGIVTADEMAEYVRTNVRNDTDGQQNPTSDRSSFDKDMLLAYVPSNVAPDMPAAPKFGALSFETNMDGVEVFIDGRSIGTVNKGQPLTIPGLVPGAHSIKAVKTGYEPDGPRDETVYPGRQSSVSIRIMVARRRKPEADATFNRGVEFYNKGQPVNYRRAITSLEEALKKDPTLSQAALFLGRSYSALFDYDAAKRYFRQAIDIDPDYLDARVAFAEMLTNLNDTDEAIRQLNAVLRKQNNHAEAFYALAHAYRLKGSLTESIEAARKSIQLEPGNPEAHLWLAESLRLSKHWQGAEEEYAEYLARSRYETGLLGKLSYLAFGKASAILGSGARRASQLKGSTLRDIWKEQQYLGYFGRCECQRRLRDVDAAIESCRSAIRYDPDDPYAHYELALAYATKANSENQIEFAAAALKHFRLMLSFNADLIESDIARKNIESIESALKQFRTRP